MKKRNLIKHFVYVLVPLAGFAILLPFTRKTIAFDRIFGSVQNPYTLSFTSSNAPTSSDMEHHTVYTANGNPIDVTYTNCEVSSGKHIKMNAGGEIVVNTKLNGVYSGSAIYDGTLKIWCGLEPDQMWESSISNTTNEFYSTYKFNYVKLVATTDVLLESFNLIYSCSDVGSQTSTVSNIDAEVGTVINYSNLEYEMGNVVYFGAKGLGNNNVTVKVNDVAVNKATSGAYEFPLGPDDHITVSTDYDINEGVTVNCYSVNGGLLDTKNVKFSTHDAYSGTIYAPVIDGYVANTPTRKMLLDKAHQSVDIYYSELSESWDGTTASASFTGEGTLESPYLIESGADLKLIANSISSTEKFEGKYFKMTKSIDLGNHAITIGASSTNGFNGTFDGNNCAITGLNSSNALFYSLLAKATVKNLSLSGEIKNTSSNTVLETAALTNKTTSGSKITNCYNYVNLNITSTVNPGTGGHAAFVSSGTTTITNCENYGDILNKSTKRYYTAGIIANPSGTTIIENTINWGTISGGTATGGIVGRTVENSTVTISNCENYGEIQSLYLTANYLSGGLVGAVLKSSSLTVSNSRNYGHVIGTNSSNSVRATQFGGILGAVFGAAKSVTIDGSENYGEIEADYVLGGIYGGSSAHTSPVEVNDCTNYGYIHSNGHSADNSLGYVGGIAGWVRSTTYDKFSNCVNWGEVEARYAEVTIKEKTSKGGSGSAGICSYTGGNTNVTIDSCMNFGYIHNPTSASGGIISGSTTAASNLAILNCSNYGTISSTTNVGGIAGIMYQGNDPTNCINKGLLIGKTYVGDIIGRDSRT